MAEDKDGQSKSPKLVSPSQVAGGALASVTAAYLGSHLGVAGTFWGAGLSSVIISVGGAVYQRSLERTREKATITAARTALARAKGQSLAVALRPLGAKPGPDADSQPRLSTAELDRLRQARSRPDIVPVATDLAGQATRKIHPLPNAVQPGMHWPGGEHVVDDPHAEGRAEPTIKIRLEDAPAEPAEPSHAPRATTKLISKDELPTAPPRRGRWAMVAVTGVLVFVGCMLLVTGVERVTGKPLSGGQPGTSLGRVFRPDRQVTPVPPASPATTTREQRPSRVPEPTRTVPPPPPVEPSQTPRPSSQPPSSQEPTPTTSAPSTTSTAPQTPQSGTLLPGQWEIRWLSPVLVTEAP
jgi:hypothetical protein